MHTCNHVLTCMAVRLMLVIGRLCCILSVHEHLHKEGVHHPAAAIPRAHLWYSGFCFLDLRMNSIFFYVLLYECNYS